MIKGELQSRKWQTKTGEDRYSVFVQAQELKFLTPKQQHTSEFNAESVAPMTDETTDETEFCASKPCHVGSRPVIGLIFI